MKTDTTGDPAIQHQRSTISPLPPSDLSHNPTLPRKHTHRKTKPSGARFREKIESSRRGIRPKTPLLKWKFDESNDKNNSVEEAEEEEEEEELSSEVDRETRWGVRPVVSARKLGAELWRQLPTNFSKKLDFQSRGRGSHLWTPTHSRQLGKIRSSPQNNIGHGPLYMSVQMNVHQYKFEPSIQFPNPAMEGSTKWNSVNGKTLGGFNHIFGQAKLLNVQSIDAQAIPTLEKELEQARTRINELENERKSSKKKLEQFLQKVSEEKSAWKSREHEKIRVIIDDMKAEMSREKKNRQRLEMVNSKLVDELAGAKLSAKCYLKEYEKERKSRELIEEVCDELAKEIEEDNAKVETIKRESQKLCEEVEEERQMLQMAEVWREERVQMKLVDAKVMLEEKYAQMNMIVMDIEAFLSSKKSTRLDSEEMKKTEFLKEAAASVNMQCIRELKYDPPNPDDMFSVFEDIYFGESNGNGYSSNIYTDQSGEQEKCSSEWETVSHPEDHGSSYSPDGSESFQVRNVSRELERNGREEIQPAQFKKASYISRLWRSHSGNGDNYKITSTEEFNQKLSNGRLSTGAIMSPDLANPHKSRGMKRCVEWPRSAQKSSLKSQLSGEKIESQKIQLRQVLKEKI